MEQPPEPVFAELIRISHERVEESKVLGARVAAIRKNAYVEGWTDELRAAHDEAVTAMRHAIDEGAGLADKLAAAAGIPEEILALLDKAPNTSDPVDRTWRSSVRAQHTPSTGLIEEAVASALEFFMPRIEQSWWRANASLRYSLGPDFLESPLSITRGVRVAGEQHSIHQFAQMLQLGQALLSGSTEYDWFAGSSLTPQLAALGVKLPALARVDGDVDERISALWRLPSEMTEATVYELVVAASCAEWGRDVEFLKAGQEKTPDLRVHDYPIPLVVECKRRHSVNEADIAEDAAMCALYVELRTACRGLGVTGVIELHLTTPPEAIPLKDIVAACVRHRLAADPTRVTAHNWGTVRYLRSPSRLRFHPTRLYSPNFLRAVFNWDTDLPSHDGIVCQVKHPRGFIVDEAREPLALVWTNEHPKVLSRRTRAMMALFAKAMRQIPPGEIGLVYACYQEGDREVVADTRTRQLIERLREWTHEWQISMPATIISRLVARPLHDGAPDLIETGLQFYSATDGSPDWFAEFPTKVFTP